MLMSAITVRSYALIKCLTWTPTRSGQAAPIRGGHQDRGSDHYMMSPVGRVDGTLELPSAASFELAKGAHCRVAGQNTELAPDQGFEP
jgi:hypothetical protein